ncbi:uncharacterized protein [Coffea arabica]|uniref:Reverse transcriptase domain-containing protein n=1 Tax=Coffea arabica TaxID=13443 RepID=A0ABM4VMM9_COFAR
MVVEVSPEKEVKDKIEKGGMIIHAAKTGKNGCRSPVNESKQGGKWRRSLRNKRVPLRDITGSRIVSRFGEKRKMQDDKQELNLMEEDFEEGSKHKLVKKGRKYCPTGRGIGGQPHNASINTMKVAVWNCRGAGSPLTIPQLKELVGIYASTEDRVRKHEWKTIEQKKREWGEKWAVKGDFNDICSNGEKWGGRERFDDSFSDFNNFISGNELVDIGFVGIPWTWSNTWDGEGEVKERLDRCLGSVGWMQLYENVTCEHIEKEASDHYLLMVDTNPQQRRGKRRFFFDQRWAKDKASDMVIKTAWGREQHGSRMFKVVGRIKECRLALIDWNKTAKGNAKAKIQEIKKQLKATKAADEWCNKGVITTLKLQLSKAYKDEELYWSQKSRSRWLKKGDKNTAYFHQSVMAKRKPNRISILQKTDGEWCRSDQEIEDELCTHYKELFTSNNPTEFDEVLQGIPRTNSNLMNAQLIKPVDELEIKQAIFSMFPNKAPGVDGMSPCFFQTYWSIIKDDIVNAITSFFHTGNLLKSINETIIFLIPKVDNPVMLTNFRPISLSNVLYKTISKLLANRLKKVLKHCISPSQSAFV